VRDGVLARLLALNAKRYAEEEALGLHSKGGGKKGAMAGTSGKLKRGPPANQGPNPVQFILRLHND